MYQAKIRSHKEVHALIGSKELLMNLSTNIIKIVYKLFRVFPIKRNKIVFSSYMGKGFGDNGKYIALELLKQPSKYDIVWLCKNMDEHFPEGIRKVKYRSLKSI